MKKKKKIKKIIERLSQISQTVTFAESCTGGRIAAAFTAIPGASAVLNGSCITYSNEIKHAWLGVSDEVLQTYGAVSKECVLQMLEGICKMADSQYAIGTSGIAGPTGGTPQKPVGTVYIGIKTPEKTYVYHCFFEGNREKIQKQSVTFAIDEMANILKI
ncbi:MAG: CinA family protein [Sulfurovum sp.]|nr:CinA family protein [Sulfurovum sp.]MDD3602925.1 CinA family protein [Sulfurovum sp.]